MKLNYREKIILGVFLAVAILLATFLGLVKPKTKTLKDNQARLQQLEDERDEIQAKIDQIKPLQTKIQDIYKDTNKIAEIFVPSEDVDTPVEVDKLFQKYADENNVRIKSLEAGSTAVGKLDYYYFKDNDFAASYREEVDLGGQLQAEYDANHAEENALKERSVETLFETKYGILVNGTKEDIFNYLEAIKNIDDAVNVRSVQIYDYSFGQDAIEQAMKAGAQIAEAIAQQQEETPAEGEEAEGNEENAEEAQEEEQQAAPISVTVDGQEFTNKSDCQIVISVYSVFNMPEPNVDYIPDAE